MNDHRRVGKWICAPLCGALALAAFVFLLPRDSMQKDVPRYDLTVTIHPGSSRIEGVGAISVPPGSGGYLFLHNLDVKGARAGERLLEPTSVYGEPSIQARGGERTEVEFESTFPPVVQEEVVENVGVAGTNIIDTSGIMLIKGWYPSFSGKAIYSLRVTIPGDFEVVSESDSTSVTMSPEREAKKVEFSFSNPLPGITLVGGRYTVRTERYGNVEIETYFYPEDSHISPMYMENMKRYIDLYVGMLGGYPYRSFRIVENVYQTGYSFPTYTLLGSRIVHLPFVPEVSLGHEFLHQWFGHHVDVDYGGGNWSEGLTTYLADHWYKELNGEGYRYRKKILVDFMNYVAPEEDMPVVDFRGRTDFATKAIGYGKVAMIFHMLRKRVGDEAFFSGLKRFIGDYSSKEAGWGELARSFGGDEDEEGVREFFRLWTKGTGAPSLHFEPPVLVRKDGRYILKVWGTQEEGQYIFDIPLRVDTGGGSEKFAIPLSGKDFSLEIELKEEPSRVVIDEDYDIFRRLESREWPAVISAFTGDKASTVIIPESEQGALEEAGRFFEAQGYRVIREGSAEEETLRGGSFLVMYRRDHAPGVVQKVLPHISLPDGGFVVKAVKSPVNPGKVALLLVYHEVDELYRSYKKIFRYGNYSLLVFKEGRNVVKEIEPVSRGIILAVEGGGA